MQLILNNCTLIDGTGTPPENAQRVVIEGQRIVAVGEAVPDECSTNDNRVIDLHGNTAMPGFFDMHVHSTSHVLEGRTPAGTTPQVTEWLTDPDHLVFTRAIGNVQRALRAGITSIRDCGGRDGITIWLKNMINQGLLTGPRMYVSGQPVTTTAGHLNFFGQVADNKDEILKAVRRQVHLGADFIKVCATGGAMTPGSNRSRAQYSAEELTALVEDAHRLGRTVAAHTLCAEGMSNVVEAGCDTIEHCYWYGQEEREYELDEEVARELARKGLFASPVIGAGDQAGYLAEQCPVDIKDPWPSANAKQDFYDVLRSEYGGFINAPESQLHFANLRRMRELGTRFIVGSDAGAGMTRFQDLWLCMAVFVASLEFSVVEAIQSATQLAAEALGVDHDLGTVETGKLADIVVVAGNPVDEGVWRLREVETVIKGGRIVVERSAAVDQIAMNHL
jgi:imidazolonepropionase-like amidohydrolase